jgi:hypothetical protein
MVIQPVSFVERYTQLQPIAGLASLAHKKGPSSGPEAVLGSALEGPPLTGKIYGPDGKLQALQGPGANFLAHV